MTSIIFQNHDEVESGLCQKEQYVEYHSKDSEGHPNAIMAEFEALTWEAAKAIYEGWLVHGRSAIVMGSSYGRLYPSQRNFVEHAVRGKVVHDLGAGFLGLAHELLNLGATEIIAIDRFEMPEATANIKRLQGYFHDYHEPIDTAFVSWPINWQDLGLLEAIDRASTVIYLGSNHDGNMCGFHEFWAHLRQREVLAHVPERRNTLIVYGPKHVEREELPEEHAALNTEVMWSYPGV